MGEPLPVRADDARAGRRAVRERRLPAGDDRVRRRLDDLRRLAVPQLRRAPGRTSTTCATRSSRSSTSNYATLPGPEHRGLSGKSSGGYGAMVVPMLRPDVFGALASHAGDALFECCYLPNFPQLARKLRDEFDGSLERFWEELQAPGPARHGALRELRPDRLRRRLLARPRAAGQGAAAVRDRHRAADRRRLGSSGCEWDPVRMAPLPRRRAALDEARLPRRRQGRRVVPRPRGAGVQRGARQARRRAHARAVRRQARRDRPTATRARSASSCWRYGDAWPPMRSTSPTSPAR